MFEDKTFDNILNGMLDSITANVDKRQGSIIYDSLAPKSFLVAKLYQDLNWIIDNVLFIDTATGVFLDKKGYELGVIRNKAIAAERNCNFVGAVITDNTRFFTNDGLYWVYSSSSNTVTCEALGIVGNSTTNGSSLIPVSDIQGLISSTIEDIVVPGSEQEDDESYRQRMLLKISQPEANSNKAQIKKWCLDVAGIGNARIISLWNGANTVKAILIDTEKQPISQKLIDSVQNYIDPGSQGLGEGVADIGVIFTASSATATPINVSFKFLQLATGKNVSDAKVEVEEGLKKYLQSIAFVKEKVKDVVRYQEISAMVLNTDSIIDFENLTINGLSANIEIELENVATVGTVTITQ